MVTHGTILHVQYGGTLMTVNRLYGKIFYVGRKPDGTKCTPRKKWTAESIEGRVTGQDVSWQSLEFADQTGVFPGTKEVSQPD